MNIPENNFCVPATINQYLGWADAGDLHKFTFYGILPGHCLKKPEDASFVLRDLLKGFLSSEILKNLFYSTNSGLQSLLEEAFSKEKDVSEKREYQSLVIQAELALSEDMVDTCYSFVGISDTVKKSCGHPETYDIAYEPLRNLLDLRVSFPSETILSDMREGHDTYGYQKGYPNIRLVDVLETIFNDLTWGGNNDAAKKIEHDKLGALLRERTEDSKKELEVFYTLDEVKLLMNAKTNKEIPDNG